MIIMCAWCNKNMGEKPSSIDSAIDGKNGRARQINKRQREARDNEITHGICQPCADHLKSNFKIIVPSWGDRVKIPRLNRTKVL